MVLRLIPCSPRRRVRFATVAGGLKAQSNPVEPDFASASLTPATGARTTRFCRTQPPGFANRLRPKTDFDGSKGFAGHGVVRLAHRLSLTSLARPAITLRADAVASTTSRPAFMTIAIRPSCRSETARSKPLIWGQGESEYFHRRVWTTQIRLNPFRKLDFSRTVFRCGGQAVDGTGGKLIVPDGQIRCINDADDQNGFGHAPQRRTNQLKCSSRSSANRAATRVVRWMAL